MLTMIRHNILYEISSQTGLTRFVLITFSSLYSHRVDDNEQRETSTTAQQHTQASGNRVLFL